MSVLRMLSPKRATSPSGSSQSSSIQISIRVPSYGSIFMPFPNPIPDPNTPRTDKELFGDLEVAVPRGMGRVKCKAITVGVRTSSRLDMGRGKPEEDVLYEGKVEIRGGNADGVVLEEGLQRFTFNLIIPGNLAPHDYHPGHRVDNILFAEVQGIEDTSISQWFRRGSSPSSSRGTSPSIGSRSRSASPHFATPPHSLTILRQEASLPRPPTYDAAFPQEQTPWLVGNHYAERALILIYNPDPAGGASSLDVRLDTAITGLGPLSVNYLSDEWSIAAFLRAKMSIPAPSPHATIFHVRVSLLQTVDITSPRDGSKAKVEKSFSILEYGPRMTSEARPDESVDSIWRGTEAGGEDTNELLIDGRGRLPIDYEGRPTTLEGVETPIKVSHILRTEVFFSIRGESVTGESLPDGGPGELRVMRLDKNVILPACFLIPGVLNLPMYEADDNCPMWTTSGKTCPLCKTFAGDQFCKTCPPTAIPHPRHDHDPKLVGNASGVCDLCCQRVLPTGSGEWKDCACGLSREDMIDRMKRISLGDRDEEHDVEEERGRRGREEKEEAERGRVRAR